jgi:hypothetical protein
MLCEIGAQLHECGPRRLGGFMTLSDWIIANPESSGLRSEPLRDLVDWLDGFGQANIHSVLVVRHGRLLFEHYRAGEDECWGEPLGNVVHGPNSKHDLRSVTISGSLCPYRAGSRRPLSVAPAQWPTCALHFGGAARIGRDRAHRAGTGHYHDGRRLEARPGPLCRHQDRRAAGVAGGDDRLA